MKQKHDALRQSVNQLIERYGDKDPALLQDLIQHRNELESLFTSSPIDYERYAIIALRTAQLAKWIYDHFPPPYC